MDLPDGALRPRRNPEAADEADLDRLPADGRPRARGLVRLLVGTGRRTVGFALLTLGFTALLVTDAIYGWKLLHGGYQTGALLDIGWATFYALLGASTLHPSARARSSDTAAPAARLTRKRIALLALASLATPLLMLANRHLGGASDVVVLIASVILFALVLLRMTGLMLRHDEAVQLQAERTAELAAVERSAKAKDAFVSQVSHELRTPLTSILGYLAFLSEEGTDEPSPAERNSSLPSSTATPTGCSASSRTSSSSPGSTTGSSRSTQPSSTSTSSPPKRSKQPARSPRHAGSGSGCEA